MIYTEKEGEKPTMRWGMNHKSDIKGYVEYFSNRFPSENVFVVDNKEDGQIYDYAKGGRIKVGTFNEEQMTNKEDKVATEKARKESGLNYTDTKLYKKKGKYFLDVFLIPNEEYYNSSKFSEGGKVEKKENNEMLIGGIAGVLLGIFLNK